MWIWQSKCWSYNKLEISQFSPSKLLLFDSACNCISPWLEMLFHCHIIIKWRQLSLLLSWKQLISSIMWWWWWWWWWLLKLQKPTNLLNIKPQIKPSKNHFCSIYPKLLPLPPLPPFSTLLCFPPWRFSHHFWATHFFKRWWNLTKLAPWGHLLSILMRVIQRE